MDFSLIPDIISLVILVGVFFFLWKEKQHFHSLKSFIGAAVCLLCARLLDILLVYPKITFIFENVHITNANLILLNYISNFADVFGVIFLAIGLVKTIKFQIQNEQTIQQLESFLPMCSICKKIRNEFGVWKSIEDYFLAKGETSITHGLCPECASAIIKGIDKAESSNGDKI